MENTQLCRTLAIIKSLTRTRYGLTKSEILEALEKEEITLPSDRTFQRDINELKTHGYDIVCGKDYRYKLENREEVISASFSFEEIQALQMCRDLFKYFDGTHLKDAIDSAIDAVIGSQKTPFCKEDLEECRDNFIVHLGWRRDFFDKKELLDSVASGVNSVTKLKITYKKPNTETETVIVEPYKIVLYHDTLYLLAKRENDTRGLRLFHISRFEEIEETYEEFTKDRDLIRNYEKDLSHCFGIFIDGDLCDVLIEFDKSVEYMIRERLWHSSQVIETRKDCVVLKLRVYKSGEFMAWVKSWGEMVRDIKFRKASM
ncbi:MAG: WYL domain-containing protein [Chitinispirillia bacterium]|nr:WYL domain-containing protein [Chitinispirillia bacterium]